MSLKPVYFIVLSVLFALSFTMAPAHAQSPEDVCPNAGTSQYTECIAQLEAAFDKCTEQFGPGNQSWSNCQQQAIDEFTADEPLPPVDATLRPVDDGVANAGNTPLVASSEKGCDPRTSGDTSAELTSENCSIVQYLVTTINFLSAVAGMAIVGSIIFAGYQYMTARDNSGQIEAAKKRIIWAITALVLLIFTYAFLNYLVPGGVI